MMMVCIVKRYMYLSGRWCEDQKRGKRKRAVHTFWTTTPLSRKQKEIAKYRTAEGTRTSGVIVKNPFY